MERQTCPVILEELARPTRTCTTLNMWDITKSYKGLDQDMRTRLQRPICAELQYCRAQKNVRLGFKRLSLGTNNLGGAGLNTVLPLRTASSSKADNSSLGTAPASSERLRQCRLEQPT